MTTKRISYIDMAKGIGIIFVVYAHSIFSATEVNTWIYSFHMPLFFILSGMLLSHTDASAKNMASILKKKSKTILVPYLFFSILSVLFSAILDADTFSIFFPDALMQTFVFYGISVLWFLPALLFGEIIFLFIRKHTSLSVSALLSLGICLLVSFTANTYHYYYPIDFENPLSVLGAYLTAVFVRTGVAVTFLALGYFSHYLFFKKEHKKYTYLVLAVVFLVLNLYLSEKNGSVDLRNMVFNDYKLYYTAAYCGSMFFICLCAALPSIKPLEYLGKNSLIIMVTHMNCRFLGISYAIGTFALSLVPALQEVGFITVSILALILIELLTIFVINRYAPFLIGKKMTSSKS